MKKKLKKLITILTVIMTMTAVFTMKTHAISLDYSGGSSSNNTGAKATTSGFTVSYDKAKDNICGYRFSVVSSLGTPKSGTKAVNVYLSDITIGNSAYSSGQRFIVSSGVVANKKQLANGTKVGSTASTQGCEYKSGNCGFYSSLPQNPDSIGTWIKNSANNYQNLSRIYVICGTNLSNATESDYVLTEPIFRMKLAGVQTAATATELALYGAAVSGGDRYNGGNGNLYNAGSGTLWNLMYYINREFPNCLYVSSNTGVYNAVSVKTSGRYTYKTIIQNGYGCSVLTVKNVITIKKDYTNTINHWAWGFNGNGNNGNRNAFRLSSTTFTKKSGDVFTLTEADATAIPNGFYLNNTYQIGTSSVDGTWKNYPYGTKFTQKDYSMGFEYDYHPYTYNITYDLDGGTNDPNNPTSYNVLYGKDLYSPTKSGYEFLGWMRDFTNPKINLSALNHNYNYYNVLNDIEPGTEYEITIGTAKTTAGSASQFSCVIYDFTNSKCLVQKNIAFGNNLSFSVTCPASADTTHDIRLLFYSGVSGSTSGIATVYSNVNIKYYLDGINKGCGSAFSSPNELYSELSKRTTGDIKLSALSSLKPVCANFKFLYAFLKGSYLVDLYAKGLRTSNDIDILINPKDITELTAELKAVGFKQGNVRNETFIPASRTEIISSRMNRGETVPFVKEVDLPGMKFLEIDVNFSLGFRPGVDEQVVCDFLNHTQPMILNTISTLNKTDFLMHLCAHLYKEATVMSWIEMGRDISLYKYCDIYLFLRKFMDDEFARELIQRVNNVGLNKECYYALNYAKELFEIDDVALDMLLKEIQPADLSFMTQVLDPQTGKVYSYDMQYKEWVFCSDRKGKLYET